MQNNVGKCAAAGIAGEVVYFLSMMLFLTTHTNWALTLWEVMSVAGAFVILAVLAVLSEGGKVKGLCRTFMLISLSGTTFLTSAAHFVSIGVVRPLEAQGTAVPEYFKIGTFPSIEMTLDYIAWGLFMGLAFLFVFLGTKGKALRAISLICAVLCFAGFIGSFFSGNLWYFAPMGYGVGFLIMSIHILRTKRFE